MSDRDENEETVSVSMRSLTGGASVFVGGKSISHLAGFLVNLLLTRGLGAQLYGVYSYLNVISTFVLQVSNLGSDKSILKFVPQYEDSPRQRSAILILAYLTSFAASIVIGVVLYALAPMINSLTLDEPVFTGVLQIFAFIIPFNTLRNLISALFKSYEDMASSVLVEKVVSPVSKLVAVGAALALGASLSGVIAATIASAVLTVLFGFWLIHRRLDDTLQLVNPTGHATEFYNFTLPLSIGGVGSALYEKIDLLMVGVFLTSSAVGIYNISVLLATFLSLPIIAFNQLFPPIASKLYSRGQMSELNIVYATTNRWILTLTLFPFLAIVTFTDRILLIFGEEFIAGASVLLLLSAAQLVNATVGPSGYILMMTGHQYVTMMNNVMSALLNIVLNYYFIMQFGLIGAALATSLVVVLINLAKVTEVWFLKELFPFNRQYYKPILAGLISLLGMGLVRSAVQSQYLVVLSIGGLVGGLLYVGVLYTLGLGQAEQELITDVIRN